MWIRTRQQQSKQLHVSTEYHKSPNKARGLPPPGTPAVGALPFTGATTGGSYTPDTVGSVVVYVW